MAKITSWFDCDLQKAVHVQTLSGNVFSLDNLGSRISVRIFDGGEKVTVSGSVTANCILPDGSTVNVDGSLTTVDGQSVAYMDVPQSCLLIPGWLKITIKLTDSSVITTLAAILTNVYRTKTDNVITPSQQIITDWNAEISSAIATQNAAIATQDGKIDDLKSAFDATVIDAIGETNILSNSATKNYEYYIKTGIPYKISSGSVKTTVTLCPEYPYNANNVNNYKLWDNKANQAVSFIAQMDYRCVHVWQSGSVNTHEITIQINLFNELNTLDSNFSLLEKSVIENEGIRYELSNNSETNYNNFEIKNGETYHFMSGDVYTTAILCPESIYNPDNPNNLTLWDAANKRDFTFVPQITYKSMRIWVGTQSVWSVVITRNPNNVLSLVQESIEKVEKYRIVQSESTHYQVDFLPNKKYLIDITANANVTIVLYKNTPYDSSDATNIRLVDYVESNIKTKCLVTVPEEYRYMYIYQNNSLETIVTVSLFDDPIRPTVTKLTPTCDIISPTYVQRMFYDTGKLSNAAHTDCFSTEFLGEDGIYLATFPDEIKVVYNALSFDELDTKQRKNQISNSPVSVICHDFCRFAFYRKDGQNFAPTDQLAESIKIYHIHGVPSNGTVRVAASDSETFYKEMADIVVDGTNDSKILTALLGCWTSINIELLSGTYFLTEAWTVYENTKCALPLSINNLDNYGSKIRRYITMTGDRKSTPQTIDGVKLVVTQGLHQSFSSVYHNFVLGVPYPDPDVKVTRSSVSVNFSNFNIIGYLYDKPITYVDTTRCLSTMIDGVNVRSWHENINDYATPDDEPNAECCGIRVGRGSNYGIQNYVKRSNIWYCGKGFALNGEHFIIEDVKCHHDVVGIFLGDRKTVGLFEHPNVFIGCSIEACKRLMVLTKNGITEEQEYVYDPDNNIVHSTIIFIGTSTELSWQIPINDRVPGGSDTQRTDKILEIIKGCYRGRLEIDESDIPPFEEGSCTGMKYICYAHGQAYSNMFS